MLEVWQSGGARAHIESEIEKFKSGVERYKEQFSQAISALEQAIQNWEA